MAKWMGIDHNCMYNRITDKHYDMIKSAGANCVRDHSILALWRENIDVYSEIYAPYNIPYRTLMAMVKAWCDARGLRLIIGTMGNTNWEMPNFDEKADVILNVDGLGDSWISGWGELIRGLQPHAIQVINEVSGVESTKYAGTMTQEAFLAAYRTFVMRAIDSWRAIKPDIIIHVGGCPFWDLKSIAANPIPRPNVIYAMHVYYAGEGLTDYVAQWERDYWEGRLQQGKINLENWLLNDEGLQALLAARLPVVMEEAGSPLANPNALVFMQDLFDICKKYNVGVIQHALAPAPPHTMGLLTEDWSALNEMGQVWARNMAEAAPPPAPQTALGLGRVLVAAGFLAALVIGATIVNGEAKKKLEELPQNVKEAIEAIADYVEAQT